MIRYVTRRVVGSLAVAGAFALLAWLQTQA